MLQTEHTELTEAVVATYQVHHSAKHSDNRHLLHRLTYCFLFCNQDEQLTEWLVEGTNVLATEDGATQTT